MSVLTTICRLSTGVPVLSCAYLIGVFRDLIRTHVLGMCVSRQSMRQSPGVKFSTVGGNQWWIQRVGEGGMGRGVNRAFFTRKRERIF